MENTISVFDRMNVKGKNYVIVGIGPGIGSSTARMLTEMGAKVACVHHRKEAAEEIAKEIGGVAIVADATKREDMVRAFDEAEAALGPISGVVDVIGRCKNVLLADTTDEDWVYEYEFVLKHQYLAIQLGAEKLKKAGGGSIVCIGSMSGLWPYPKQGAYGAMKAALAHLVESAAVEYAPYGIRVNSIAPGFMISGSLKQTFSEEQWKIAASVIPRGTAALPEEIATTVVFMLSDWSINVTGQTVAADGGQGLSSPTANPFGDAWKANYTKTANK